MFSRFLSTVSALALAASALAVLPPTSQPLRICADPDDLPFSNRANQGFENRIAASLGSWSGQPIEYVWQRMGRGFVREFMNTGRCDLVIGIPARFPSLLTTKPYYRSTYVFVSRANAPFFPTSIDDPGLKNVQIAVEALDEEYAPPAEAFGRRGLTTQLVGIYAVGSHAFEPIEAVRSGRADLAAVWGPVAGYADVKAPGTLHIAALQPSSDERLPFTFEISMGVRKNNRELADRLNEFIDARGPQIHAVLTEFGVPQLPVGGDGESDGGVR